MSRMGMVLLLTRLGQKFYRRAVVKEFISGAMITTGLLIITSLMIGVLIAGGLYLFYELLIYNGIMPFSSMIAVSLMAVLITLTLLAATIMYLRRLRDMVQDFYKEPSLVQGTTDMVEGFLDGLLKSSPKPPATKPKLLKAKVFKK